MHPEREMLVWSKDLPKVLEDTCNFQPGFVGNSDVDLGYTLGGMP